MFPNGSCCMKCVNTIVCEADVGADHPRQLKWEPDDKQKRSIGVRLPEHAVGPPTVHGATPKGRAKTKRRPRGTIAAHL